MWRPEDFLEDARRHNTRTKYVFGLSEKQWRISKVAFYQNRVKKPLKCYVVSLLFEVSSQCFPWSTIVT